MFATLTKSRKCYYLSDSFNFWLVCFSPQNKICWKCRYKHKLSILYFDHSTTLSQSGVPGLQKIPKHLRPDRTGSDRTLGTWLEFEIFWYYMKLMKTNLNKQKPKIANKNKKSSAFITKMLVTTVNLIRKCTKVP